MAIGGPSESPRRSTGLAMRANEPEGSRTVTLPDFPASSHSRKVVTLLSGFCLSAVTTTPGRDTLRPDWLEGSKPREPEPAEATSGSIVSKAGTESLSPNQIRTRELQVPEYQIMVCGTLCEIVMIHF